MNPAAAESPTTAFREFKWVRQEPHGRRRWFESPEIELVVWFDDSGVRTGFQLHYGTSALTWRHEKGFTHSRVDSGDSLGNKLTPLLIPDADVPWEQIEQLFQRNAGTLEAELREFILGHLAARR
jgi:hypothetical protein